MKLIEHRAFLFYTATHEHSLHVFDVCLPLYSFAHVAVRLTQMLLPLHNQTSIPEVIGRIALSTAMQRNQVRNNKNKCSL